MTALRSAVALLCLLGPGPALAQGTGSAVFGGMKADTRAAVEVAADSLSVNQSDGSATFTGNVAITQGQMHLKAGTVKVVYGDGERRRIRSLDASGGVTLVSGADAAEAKAATYDVDAGLVTLNGDVLLSQGKNVMSAQQMVVNLADGTAKVQGRVRSLLQPGTAP